MELDRDSRQPQTAEGDKLAFSCAFAVFGRVSRRVRYVKEPVGFDDGLW